MRTSTVLGESIAILSWQTSREEPAGVYRLRHSGYHKSILQDPKSFSGVSRSFKLIKHTKYGKPFSHPIDKDHNRVHSFQPHE